MLLARFQPRQHVIDESYMPFFSVILAAYNEENSLGKCIDSLLALDYPHDRYEIIIGSDGSTDRTNYVLGTYISTNVNIKPIIFDERRGKMRVLNDIVPEAKGEYLLFVDADMILDDKALRFHARHYTSAEIGGVAGAYNLTSENGDSRFASENDYHSIETNLRRDESSVSSTVGLSGANYSIRKELWHTIPSDFVHDDLYSVFRILSLNKRLIFEPRAIATEEYVRTTREEFRRKARFASRGFATLQYFPELVAPSAGMTSVMILSHKVFRWLTPVILLVIIIATIIGYLFGGSALFGVLGIAELVVIGLVLLGWMMNNNNISAPLIRNLYWFAVMNLAFLAGLWTFMFGKERRQWKMSIRASLSNERGDQH